MQKSQIQVLKKSELLGQQFTVFGTAQEPYFLAKEIAEMIDYTFQNKNRGVRNITKMLLMIDPEEKVKFSNIHIVDIKNEPIFKGNAPRWFVTESGLYEILMQSRKPIAKQFKSGVKKILKEIRTTGTYLPDDDDATISRAIGILQERLDAKQQQLQIAEGKIELQKSEIKKLAPKAEYTDEVLQSKSTYTFTQMAKEFGLRSAQKLSKILQDLKVIYKQSGQYLLYAPLCSKGFTTTRTHVFEDSKDEKRTVTITVWTEAGRNFLHSIIGKERVI